MAKKTRDALETKACKRGTTTNLVPGTGRKARVAVTEPETKFCAYFVLTGNVRQASLQAGFSAWWGYSLLKMPRIQAVIQEFQSRKKDESWDYAKNKVAVTREFLDEQFIERLLKMTTHPRVGDLPIVKMFEAGYKRTGDIQPSRILQQQGQIGQANLACANAIEVYESAWLRKRKEKMNQELEEKYRDSGRPPAMPDS
jgi:hypothetical protein